MTDERIIFFTTFDEAHEALQAAEVLAFGYTFQNYVDHDGAVWYQLTIVDDIPDRDCRQPVVQS